LAITGISYHLFRVIIAIFNPDAHRNIVQSTDMTHYIFFFCYILSTLVIAYFFYSFYKSIDKYTLNKLIGASVACFASYLLVAFTSLSSFILSKAGISFHSGFTQSFFVFTAAFLVVSQLAFFIIFRKFYPRENSFLKHASTLAIIGICLLSISVFLPLNQKISPGNFLELTDKNILSSIHLITLFAYGSLLTFFIAFYKHLTDR